MRESWVRSLGQEDPLEKEMATHSSILAWRIPDCNPPDTTERLDFHFHAVEKEMATHSSVLAWRLPRTVEPGGLPTMGLHRVSHN